MVFKNRDFFYVWRNCQLKGHWYILTTPSILVKGYIFELAGHASTNWRSRIKILSMSLTKNGGYTKDFHTAWHRGVQCRARVLMFMVIKGFHPGVSIETLYCYRENETALIIMLHERSYFPRNFTNLFYYYNIDPIFSACAENLKNRRGTWYT